MNKKKLFSILDEVKNQLKTIEQLSDQQLKEKTDYFKSQISMGVSTNSLLPEAFAVVCEVDKRILGKMPYDCQILGGIALHYCYLAEMNTGEGKTLTATMPLYLNALTGKSTMLVTANEYLAIRDAEEMGPVYEFLGLSVKAGVSNNPDEKISNEDKKDIYNADIVYTTHGTLGFDYLFNNLVSSAEEKFLREFYYVIIDEADMVLLDAAQMPLVISGTPRVQSNLYKMTDFFVTTLEEDRDYKKDEGSVWLTDAGVEYAERFFGIDHFYDKENFEINRHVILALRAHILLTRDKEYVVTEKNEVSLLDNATGRVLSGMKLRGGMHQAIEAKERVEITQEFRSVASITFQNLFLLFPRFAGMSGTIVDAKKELKDIYKKKVVAIPPNKPLQRVDKNDVMFISAEEQYKAAIDNILEIHKTGQPVLVVTSTIVDTETISKELIKNKVAHSVLNANNAYWEAQIIKEAGIEGTVTVSTGMAGRGTDIKLTDRAKELGGLAVIGIGRMTNVRLERQARGRAGRQGDPGCSQFFVSLEDDIVSRIYKKKTEKYLESNQNISKNKLSKLINGAQKLQEEQAVFLRKSSVEYDKIVKRQRELIYEVRDRLLYGGTISKEVIDYLIEDVVDMFVSNNVEMTPMKIRRFILNNISYDLDSQFADENINIKYIKGLLLDFAHRTWEIKEQTFDNVEEEKDFVRLCALKAIDNAWVEQIDYLQQLQSVISGRSFAQKNLTFEYQEESYVSFKLMEEKVKKDIIRNVFLGEKAYDKNNKMYVLLP